MGEEEALRKSNRQEGSAGQHTGEERGRNLQFARNMERVSGLPAKLSSYRSWKVSEAENRQKLMKTNHT